MSTLAADFDRLAQLDQDGWTANNHYHDFLLSQLPPNCGTVLEIGCGTGAFSRRLAERGANVLAIDLSPEMIRVARDRSSQLANVSFEVADVMSRDFPRGRYDCIASIATLHHVPQRDTLLKLKEALKPGGVMLILDLFQPERTLLSLAGWRDSLAEPLRLARSMSLRLTHNHNLRPPCAVRAAWSAHGKTDRYLTMREARSLYDEILPGAVIHKHLLWRYSVVWRKA